MLLMIGVLLVAHVAGYLVGYYVARSEMLNRRNRATMALIRRQGQLLLHLEARNHYRPMDEQ